MESFIQAVQQVEDSNPGLCPLALVRALRKTAGHDDEMTIHFLGASYSIAYAEVLEKAILMPSFSFFDKAIHHIVTDYGEERGVVLAPDGTTDFPPSNRLGPNGCWDSVERPKLFKLSRPATLATDAVINGGMDGAILGMDYSNLPASEQPQALSKFLKGYYSYVLHEGRVLMISLAMSARGEGRSLDPFWSHSIFTASFVVGSDGYVYEGRGWNYLGTHTRGHNSIGYGVSIIGNYTAALPSHHAMDLLRHRLVQCAVDGGGLAANFTIQGHRQVVNYTSCPGDAFFSEIRSWEHFRE
ncbi:hypothetical protein F7725_005653 [Dissostichus mawsoni]|uniref:Peptidoglycan recognition protein family domain-containing protein n=1 Tax=Dissostichus mawsoni TaxID=36200 RepID=A0A7J5YW13_DISMA|nr:hypothetical protein F7725_005653 [Dissostichus mawsoni]